MQARSAFDSEGSLFNDEQILKLKKLIRELEKIRGRHTELVSVYVPSGYSITDITNQIFQEKGTASNIKSKSTRKNVMTALEKILQHLRLFKQTPPNGLVIFCGNISLVEGKDDIRLWSFEPPAKLTTKMYWCDQVFVLEPLKNFVKEREVYGLIVLDAKEANIGVLMGKSVQPMKRLESTVPSKTVKGGMSQSRYNGIREDAINEFLTKVGEVASQVLLKQENLKGVIVGGPGPVKERFIKGEYLHYELRKTLLGVKDVGETSEYGLQELVQRSEDLMMEASVVRERELLDKFFTELQKDGKVTYGFHEVKKSLEAGAVETLIISESFDWVHAKLKCSKCSGEIEKDLPREKIESQLCEKCGEKMNLVEDREFMEVLMEDVKNLGAKVEIVSDASREGVQFKELGGIGALLRWKI